VDSIAREDQIAREIVTRRPGAGREDDLVAVFERDCIDLERAMIRIDGRADKRNALEVGLTVSGRLIAERLKLRGDVARGDRMSPGAGTPPFEQIVREVSNVRGECFRANGAQPRLRNTPEIASRRCDDRSEKNMRQSAQALSLRSKTER